MYEYDDEVLDTFLKKQTQLFSEEVADTPEAAEEFLEDCMAVVCKNIKEVRDYFDDVYAACISDTSHRLQYWRQGDSA